MSKNGINTKCSSTSSVANVKNIKHLDHGHNVLKRLQELLNDEQLCDVVLIADIDGTRIQAHRVVLSASSEYFDAMFTGSLCEAKQTEVTLKEIAGNVLQPLVQFCYSGCIDFQENTVETLLAAASLLQFNVVAEDCFQYLRSKMNPSNCLELAFIADQYSNNKFKNYAKAYVCEHFNDVCNNEEFLHLDVEQLSQYLASDELNVPSEEDVFLGLMRWINYDQDEREQHIPRLLALVRLHLMRPTFIFDHVEPACVTIECQRIITHAFKYYLIPERKAHMPKARVPPTKEILLVIHAGFKFRIECYLPNDNKWELLVCLPALDGTYETAAAIFDNKLIIAGGRQCSELNDVHCIQLDSLNHSTLNSMQSPRSQHVLAVLKGSLYAVGGMHLNTVERYDALTQCWNYVASMSVERAGAGIAVLNDRLYVIGGSDLDNTPLSSIECYDPETNQWTLKAPMCESRAYVGCTTVNGYLYAVGGMTLRTGMQMMSCVNSAERYDPVTNEWTLICSVKNPSYSIACSFLANNLIAAGGEIGTSMSTTVEKYDSNTNTWQMLAPLRHVTQVLTVTALINRVDLQRLLSMENKDPTLIDEMDGREDVIDCGDHH